MKCCWRAIRSGLIDSELYSSCTSGSDCCSTLSLYPLVGYARLNLNSFETCCLVCRYFIRDSGKGQYIINMFFLKRIGYIKIVIFRRKITNRREHAVLVSAEISLFSGSLLLFGVASRLYICCMARSFSHSFSSPFLLFAFQPSSLKQ